MLQLEHELVLLAAALCQLLLAFFRVHIHAAKFVHLELFPVLTDPCLPEKDGTGIGQPDGKPHRDGENHGNQGTDQPARDVHEPLQENVTARDIAQGGRNGQMAADPFHVFVPGLNIVQVRECGMDGDAHAHEAVDQIHGQIGFGRHVQIHLIHPVDGQILLQRIGRGHNGDRFDLRVLVPERMELLERLLLGGISSLDRKAREAVGPVV